MKGPHEMGPQKLPWLAGPPLRGRGVPASMGTLQRAAQYPALPPRDTSVPYLMQPSILSLVGVMVQVDAVEAGLHLAALSSHQMAAALALPRLHGTPGTRAAQSDPTPAGMPLTPCVPEKTHRLLRAPPTSQSHGRQPGRSWLSPQCSGWGRQRCQRVPGHSAMVWSTVHSSRASSTTRSP